METSIAIGGGEAINPSARQHGGRQKSVGEGVHVGSNPDALPMPTGAEAQEQHESLSQLIFGASEALGRDLTYAELQRIVDEGPHAGLAPESEQARNWLAMLEFEYIKPAPYNTVWDQFVSDRIDSIAPAPEWVSTATASALYHELDERTGEDLSEAGWAWALADPSADNLYDPESVWDEFGCLDLDRVVGLDGFIFRQTSLRESVLRHCPQVSEENINALGFLQEQTISTVALDSDIVNLALILHQNT